jgi:hypothetical protein
MRKRPWRTCQCVLSWWRLGTRKSFQRPRAARCHGKAGTAKTTTVAISDLVERWMVTVETFCQATDEA